MLKNRPLMVLLSIFVLIAVSFVGNSNTSAQGGNGLKISPIRTELEIPRESSNQVDITIENITDLPINAQFILNDFVADPEGSGSPQIILDPDSDYAAEYSIKNFIQELPRVDLQPGEAVTTTFDIVVPENANPGSYFGVIRAAPQNSQEDFDEPTQLSLTASVGSLIFITVPGDTVELLTLKDITVNSTDATETPNPGKFFESAPKSVSISLNNEGNIITKPFGRVTVRDMGDNEVYSYEFNEGDFRGNVLPASFRTFTDNIENIGSFGRYKVEANISYGPTGGNIINAEASFWVMPWKLILIVLAVIIFIVWMLTRGIKLYNRYIVRKSKGERVTKK